MIQCIINNNLEILYRECWGIVVALVCWNIWKARNEIMFQGTKFNSERVIFLVKRESFVHCQNYNLLDQKVDILWDKDPVAAMERTEFSKKVHFISNLLKTFEVIAFSDGAWSSSNMKGGFGGILFSNKWKLVYACSSPLMVSNSLEAEVEACKFICGTLWEKYKYLKGAICVDSKNVAEMFAKAKGGLSDERFGFDSLKDISLRYPLLSVFYVNRKWNQEADILAKQGRERFNTFEKWY